MDLRCRPQQGPPRLAAPTKKPNGTSPPYDPSGEAYDPIVMITGTKLDLFKFNVRNARASVPVHAPVKIGRRYKSGTRRYMHRDRRSA